MHNARRTGTKAQTELKSSSSLQIPGSVPGEESSQEKAAKVKGPGVVNGTLTPIEIAIAIPTIASSIPLVTATL